MAKAAKPKLTDSEQVTAHIQKLEAPFSETIEALRKVILSADKTVGEQIKWNSPSFYYTGEMAPFDPKEYKRDIVVMNLHRGKILLVFPTGAKINDTTGILEGKYTDGRRIVNIADLADVKKKTPALKTVIKEWLKMVE
jgi:hypothetical protein